MSAPFEDVDETADIAIYVGMGVRQGITDSRLCRQIDDSIELTGFKNLLQWLPFFKPHLDKTESRQILQLGKAVVLQLHRIIVIEVVKSGDLVTFSNQPLAEMKTDETGSTGNEYAFHRLDPPVAGSWLFPGSEAISLILSLTTSSAVTAVIQR